MAKGDRPAELLEIGARVRQRRRELNMTQEALAETAGVSKSFVSEIEGAQTAANGLIYLRIAQALDVEVQWLLTGEARVVVASKAKAPPIPPMLSEIAEEQSWFHRQTLDVAAALDGIRARRTRGGQMWEPSRDYILRVATALRDEEKE